MTEPQQSSQAQVPQQRTTTNERLNVGLLTKLGLVIPKSYPYPGGYLTYLGFLGYGEAADGTSHPELVGRRFDETLRIGGYYIAAITCNPPVAYGQIIIVAPTSATYIDEKWAKTRMKYLEAASPVSALTGERLPPAIS